MRKSARLKQPGTGRGRRGCGGVRCHTASRRSPARSDQSRHKAPGHTRLPHACYSLPELLAQPPRSDNSSHGPIVSLSVCQSGSERLAGVCCPSPHARQAWAALSVIISCTLDSLHIHGIPFHMHLMARHICGGRSTQQLAGPHVKPSEVQGALDDVSLQPAL